MFKKAFRFLIELPSTIGWICQRWIKKLYGVNQFSFNGHMISRSNGVCDREDIKIIEIESWSIIHEMGFDLVIINLCNGGAIHWIDDYNDLIEILRLNIPD